MLGGCPYQEWKKSKRVKMKNRNNRKDPKRKRKKNGGGGDINRVKNMERKENKQAGKEWPEMVCQYPGPGCASIPPAV